MSHCPFLDGEGVGAGADFGPQMLRVLPDALRALRYLRAALRERECGSACRNALQNPRAGPGSARTPPNPSSRRIRPGPARSRKARETTTHFVNSKENEPPLSEEVTPRLVHVRAGRAAHAVQRYLQSQRREEPVWKSNFGRPTPSTRYFLRSCVCSMIA